MYSGPSPKKSKRRRRKTSLQPEHSTDQAGSTPASEAGASYERAGSGEELAAAKRSASNNSGHGDEGAMESGSLRGAASASQRHPDKDPTNLSGEPNDAATRGRKGRAKRSRQEAAAEATTTTVVSAPPTITTSRTSPQSSLGGAVRNYGTKKSKRNKAKQTPTSLTTDGHSGVFPSSLSEPSSRRGNSRGSGPSSRADMGSGLPEPRLSDLQKKMRQKLEGAQFRMINERLYTSESGASLSEFTKEPELFHVYHRGFREQVEKWPVHPLDSIIEWLRKYPKARVADFGCGEARLAATVPNKVHSFDLVSPNPRVVACDMAKVPIKAASVHVAVFCLSLMGTNLADFLREAHRVLVPGGLVKVAEVRSRFEGQEDGVDRFVDVARRLGFDCRQMDRSNKMFLMAEFKKSKRKSENGVDFEAKACIYKRR